MKFLETKIPPPLIMLTTGIGIFLLREFTPFINLPSNLNLVFGLGLIGVALAIDISGFLEFRKFKTTINPMKPVEASNIVQSGVFSRTRNPMYVGMVLLLLGWALINKAAYGFLLIPIFIKYIETFQIIPEERILKEKFGAEYENYCEKVRRWL